MTNCFNSCPELMNYEQIKAWIGRRLGAPRWNIELAECNIDDAIEDAVQWFVGHVPVKKQFSTTMIEGQVVYPYPDGADTIIDVIPPGFPAELAFSFAPFQLSPYYGAAPADFGVATIAGGGPMSAFAQDVSYSEQYRRVLSQDFNWWTDHHARRIHVSPVPHKSGTMIIEYSEACFDFQNLTYRQHDMLKRYALAIAKETLGLVRRKYSTVSTAGGERQLDGEQLVRESYEEREKLEEMIRKESYPYPIVTG